ncbi:MAG: tripartite tricarboxylate transporter TctB family protein [Gammaproteobacteria bacterium]|nr:tripartite tricarboxylate transporter TctB family protein [Gammaproteobacteria bacterium]
MQLNIKKKDLLAGLLFIFFGLFFAIGALDYKIGSPNKMGAGYFPLFLGLILVALGVILCLTSLKFKSNLEGELLEPIAWRPLIAVISANLLFGLLLRGVESIYLPPMGLFVAIFFLVMVSRLAMKEAFKILETLVLALVLILGVWLVFVVFLKVPLQLFPNFIS